MLLQKVNSLSAARDLARDSKLRFDKTVANNFPGRNEWDWHRARASIAGDNCRRNDDTTDDKALAEDAEIKAASDAYIVNLHKYYLLRDGEHGVLGRYT